MAIPRPSPYVYATWLAKMISGRVTCHYQYWYQTHYRIRKRADDFDVVRWKIEHARMLSDLSAGLVEKGQKPKLGYPVRIPIGGMAALLGGVIDCLVVEGDAVTVYDCKTGQPHASDQVQVMIYMHMLSRHPGFETKSFSGAVLYHEDRVSIPALPPDFEPHLNFYLELLLDQTPAFRNPGTDCKICSIEEGDCADRVDLMWEGSD